MFATSLRRSTTRRWALGLTAAVALWSGASLLAQIPGRNVNMVAGTDWPDGDPFLQRQNEPSIAASTRNPLHLVAGSNDYRSVDVPGLPDGVETGDAWISIYKSFDGGQRWASTLMPGYTQDDSAAGRASPLKGYQAAADPVVRAGTHGLIYYNGLVFDRGENGKSGIFLARFIDRNNKENGDPIAYLGTSLVATSAVGAVFLDKPWMVVDVPRGNAGFCRVGVDPTAADDEDDDDDHGRGGKVKRNGHRRRGRDDDRRRRNEPPDDGYQYVPAGAVYVAYTAITGDGPSLQAQIFVKRSLDCGVTWSAAMRVSSPTDAINQGATLAIAPSTGDLFVAWRRFSTPTVTDLDAVMVSRLRVNGGSFDAPGKARGLRRTQHDDATERIFEHRKKRANPTVAASVSQIDQGTGPFRFRTNAYPAMAVDGAGRAYIAWSERGFAALRSDPIDGDARILVASTTDGRTFSTPVVADDQVQAGHQLMPSLTFAGGRLMLVFYDLRETAAQQFGRTIDDADVVGPRRNTIDIRASLGTPGATPSFAPSVRVSDYLTGFTDATSTTARQLQFNPPNLPMFKLGTVPFIGDYIDVAPSPAFVPTAGGSWVFNTAPAEDVPVFHAVWTDNRDVRPPLNGNWQDYTPPTIDGQPRPSIFLNDGTAVAQCRAGNAGSRNQNIYTARIGGGLLVGSPGNSKPLSPTVQRGFVVFAQNQTTVTKTFRMQVLAQPPGGRASFEQFPLPPYTVNSPAPLTFVDVRVPGRSTASRTVYATSSDPRAQIDVNVRELAVVGGAPVPGGLTGRTVLNPDIENPDIENPDIENPDIENPDIENAEVYNPDIENPDIENPDIENTFVKNPDIENPDIENPDIENPDIENIVVDNSNIFNPDIENPDIENPDIENPDIENPDIENGTISDVTWTVTNIGNTTSAFNVNVFLAAAGVPSGINTQLVVYKTYRTPVLALDGCTLKTETRNVVLFNVPSPNFITPGEGLPDQNDPSEKNATLWLNPGEVGRVTLRVYDSNKADNVTYTNPDGTTASIDRRFNPATVTTVGISGQGVDILDPLGATEPPAVTTTGTNLFFLQQPPATVAPAALLAPVRVRVWDNTGAPLDGVAVTLVLCGVPNPLEPADACPAPPAGVLLSGAAPAQADSDGIATFASLSVNLPATGLSLRATAAAAGVVAAGTSAPFDVVDPTPLPAVVAITNHAQIFSGTARAVTVTTVPPGLAVAVTYNGSATVPSAIGAYFAEATVTSPGYLGSGTAVLKIASTLAGGGAGGGPFERACEAGVFATGFGANNGSTYGLLNAWLQCDAGASTERFVLDNTNLMSLTSTCGAGQIMVGFHGLSSTSDGAGPFVKSLGARCQDRTGVGAISTIPAVGIAGDPFGPFDCPAGQAVTGVVGGAGAVLDSVALVCATVPPVIPAIVSASPAAQVAPFQMLTLYGSNLPAATLNDVLFNQGAGDVPAQFLWGADATRAIVRLPALAADVPTTVRLKNPAGTLTTNPLSIVVSATPGTPVLTSLLNQCVGGTPLTVVTPGAQVAVEGDGIDTSGTTMVWTPVTAVGGVLTQSGTTSTAGPTGRVCSYFPTGAPAGLTPGTWTLQLRTSIGGFTSADSDAILVTVPPPTTFTEAVITGDLDILNDGVLVTANNLGVPLSAATVNGVAFGTDQGGLGGGNWLPSTGDFSVDPFSTDLDAVLSSNQYTTDFIPVTLTIGGLTPGERYRLQLLFSNDLNGTANDISVTVQGTTWVLDAWHPDAINLAAQFTAASASAVITFAPGSGPLDAEASRALLSGYVLHRVTP